MLLAFGLILISLGSDPSASQVDAHLKLRGEIQQLASEGAFREAMFLARQVGNEPQRFALEADMLYQARSYQASLGRAQEALLGGIRTPFLFSRAIDAALWLGQEQVAHDLWPGFQAAVQQLPMPEQATWDNYASERRANIDQGLANAEELGAKVTRARTLSAAVLLVALVLLAGLLPKRSSRS